MKEKNSKNELYHIHNNNNNCYQYNNLICKDCINNNIKVNKNNNNNITNIKYNIYEFFQ